MRGSERRVIIVRDTGSRYFSEAYFVLRRGQEEGAAESDMVREAQRIIGESGAYPAQRRRRGRVLTFLAGAASALAMIGVTALAATVL